MRPARSLWKRLLLVPAYFAVLPWGCASAPSRPDEPLPRLFVSQVAASDPRRLAFVLTVRNEGRASLPVYDVAAGYSVFDGESIPSLCRSGHVHPRWRAWAIRPDEASAFLVTIPKQLSDGLRYPARLEFHPTLSSAEDDVKGIDLRREVPFPASTMTSPDSPETDRCITYDRIISPGLE